MAPTVNKRIVDGGHDEVGDATTGVAPAACKSVGRADHVLVEPTGAPDLAWHEGSAQNTDEKTDDVEPCCVLDQGRQADGNTPDE